MNEREMLLRRLSSAQFAAWETHMFLDTHPNDQNALQNLKKYEERAAVLQREYESKYGPLVSEDAYGNVSWNWISSPWPWENPKEGN